MKVLRIDEEYGFREWYAVLSDERWEEVQREWRTIKGLTCLVPVPFLIPEAVQPPVLPEHEGLSGFEMVSAHIHQYDDSNLGDLDYRIPEGDFEFKGVRYTEEQVSELYDRHTEIQSDFVKMRELEEPGYMGKERSLPRHWSGA